MPTPIAAFAIEHQVTHRGRVSSDGARRFADVIRPCSEEMSRRVAAIVVKILSGTRSADILVTHLPHLNAPSRMMSGYGASRSF
jgi:hypothetical protein